MKSNLLRRVSAFCILSLAAATVTQAASISAQLDFTGGVLGSWSAHFTSSDPSIQLQQMTITLPATYFFDTQLGGFGYLTSQDFQKTGGGATVTSLSPNTTALRDGASAVTIGFSGFDAASGAFTFLLDVDGTTTLAPLQNCAGKTGLALLQCNASIVATTAANALKSTGASLVDGTEIAGAQIAFTFGKFGATPITLLADLGRTGLATAQGTFQAEYVPEPGTYGLMASGLVGLLYAARRRRKS